MQRSQSKDSTGSKVNQFTNTKARQACQQQDARPPNSAENLLFWHVCSLVGLTSFVFVDCRESRRQTPGTGVTWNGTEGSKSGCTTTLNHSC